MSDDIEVVGGSHGVVAQTDEMRDRAAALRAAADALAEADGAARALQRRLARAALATGGVVAGARAEGALDALGGIRGLAATSDDVARAGTNLLAAANEYLEAETRAREGLVGLATSFGVEVGERPWTWPLLFAVLGPAPPVMAVLEGLLLPRWMSPLPRDAQRGEALVGFASGLLVAGQLGPTPDGRPATMLAQKLAWLTGSTWPGKDLAAPTGDLTVVPVACRTARPPVTDVADMLRFVAQQTPGEGAVPGQVGVQRIDHADGTPTWVVAIPGTQDSDVFGATDNLPLAGGAASAGVALVAAAMLQAGVRPGEPVVLVGHSQGGMVAARVAADPVLQRHFTVSAVVSAGSPLGPVDLPDSVHALHLEHRQDQVPVLDGTPSPDTPTRTTVLADAPGSGLDLGSWLGTTLDAHELGAYIETAERLEDLDGSVADFRAALGEAIGDDVVGVTTWEFQGVLGDGGGAAGEADLDALVCSAGAGRRAPGDEPTLAGAVRRAVTFGTVPPLPGALGPVPTLTTVGRGVLDAVTGRP